MKISIKVSGVTDTKTNKKEPLEYGKWYVKPVNRRGMEELITFEGAEEQVKKEIRGFLKTCAVKPKSRTQRYISRQGDKVCYFLTLDSYKVLAPYLREFGYIA